MSTFMRIVCNTRLFTCIIDIGLMGIRRSLNMCNRYGHHLCRIGIMFGLCMFCMGISILCISLICCLKNIHLDIKHGIYLIGNTYYVNILGRYHMIDIINMGFYIISMIPILKRFLKGMILGIDSHINKNYTAEDWNYSAK